MMKTTHRFIIIDDESITNLIYGKIIQHAFPEAYIQTFTEPEAALRYIISAYAKADASDTILFLDINMPTLNGWDFLNIFDRLDSNIKKHFKIYMLSSSIDQRDKDRAAKNKNVLDYIEKPLTKEKVESVLSNFRVNH